jgi:HEAT repeat protein
VLLDDLDFFLLDIATEHPISLDIFNRINLDCCLNCNVPPHRLEELTLALAEMFQRGDAVARLSWPGRRYSSTFIPTHNEIEAGLRDAYDLDYRLTPEGGARWESVVEADWSLYVLWSGSLRYDWREAQSREYLEYALEVERAEGSIKGEIRWKELRPWRPLYWKTLPRGYQAKYRTATYDRKQSLSNAVIPAPPWGQKSTQRFHRGPKGLAPRKLRHPQPHIPKPEGSGLLGWKTRLSRLDNKRRMFAAACDFAQSADTDALLKMLSRSFGEGRFASARQLAKQREAKALPQLTALVLREQYLPALWVLGEIADKRSLPVMEILLDCGEANSVSGLLSTWASILVRAIARFGDLALPMLKKALASENVAASRGAVHALGLIQTKRSIAILEKERELEIAIKKRRILWHIDEALRNGITIRRRENFAHDRRLYRVACVANSTLDGSLPSDPINALVTTLNHSKLIRRRAAVDLLVEFEARDQLGEIEKLATDNEWQVRASVAFALRKMEGSQKLLKLLADDQNLVVRWLARNDIIPYEN